jgi:hypothetical protein
LSDLLTDAAKGELIREFNIIHKEIRIHLNTVWLFFNLTSMLFLPSCNPWDSSTTMQKTVLYEKKLIKRERNLRGRKVKKSLEDSVFDYANIIIFNHNRKIHMESIFFLISQR